MRPRLSSHSAASAMTETGPKPPFSLSSLDLYALLFWFSILSYLVSNWLNSGPVEALLTVAGTASCGFSWLFARALFRRSDQMEYWPLAIVGFLILTVGLLNLFQPDVMASNTLALVLRLADNLHTLLSSTVLLLALVEVFHNFSSDLPRKERLFRLSYAAGYGLLMATSVIWLRGASEGSWLAQSGDQIRMMCAGLALLLSVIVWLYRRNNALPKSKRRPRARQSITAEDTLLAERIERLFERDALHLEPDLKLTDLAQKLREHDYKISQCITGPLGYRNFNHMVNSYRIKAAKDALADPSQTSSILNIALEVGFASIGPFNRAFKAQTGQTPRAYRATALAGVAITTAETSS